MLLSGRTDVDGVDVERPQREVHQSHVHQRLARQELLVLQEDRVKVGRLAGARAPRDRLDARDERLDEAATLGHGVARELAGDLTDA